MRCLSCFSSELSLSPQNDETDYVHEFLCISGLTCCAPGSCWMCFGMNTFCVEREA